jgi:phenylacetate-CoA ligase
MRFDFKNRPQNINGYSGQAFNFLDPEAHKFAAHIVSIDLIENGDRLARESWQKTQLSNLVNHAYVRSNYWRQRIPSGLSRKDILSHIPILSRKDILVQTQNEGSLFPEKGSAAASTYETTGSTGTPLRIYVCEQNAYYNAVRSLAQFFLDDLSLDENRVQVAPVIRFEDLKKKSRVRKSEERWAGPLSGCPSSDDLRRF